MTKLTTHVLDIYSGKPGKGIKVDLYFLQNDNFNNILFSKSFGDVRQISSYFGENLRFSEFWCVRGPPHVCVGQAHVCGCQTHVYVWAEQTRMCV